jgi:two-component system sensor histidine kinase PilS (NtrC family)
VQIKIDWRQDSERNWMVQLIRAALFWLVLFTGIISSVVNVGFANWSILGPFYGVLVFAFSGQLLTFTCLKSAKKNRYWIVASFGFDAFLYSLLIYYSGLGQSLFLFLYLVNILLAGIAGHGFGALGVAFLTSIFFSVAGLISPEMKALNFFFLLALNNIAFFAVAGLSGYLSEQLQSLDVELKKTDRSLKSTQELNDVLIKNIPSGMMSFAENGALISYNEMAQNILTKSNLADLKLQSLFGEKKIEQNYRGDIRYNLSMEETKILGVTAHKIFSPEFDESIWIILFDDLTKIRQLEYSVRQNEKLAAIGGLAAGIAHEIRNPLAGISGSIEMLSQTAHTDDDRKLMKIVLREIDRLNNLITEFLDYSRPEVPPTDIVDLSSLLSEVLDSMKTQAQISAYVEQIREYSSNLKILGRRDKLKQALLNIVINSYQAMNEKGPGQQLVVRSFVTDDKLEIHIRDTGCGMKESTKLKMFEPFHTTKSKGTGLGLAVTHKILEGHGARVFVESEVGVGTEFILTFTLAS